MTYILPSVNKFLYGLAALIALFYAPIVYAQSSQTISVSPTLFEIKASQSQVWQSELRIINVNDYDMTVYPQVVNFAPLGETGRGSLLPIVTEETQGKTLAEWIEITHEAVIVPRQQAITIPFTIRAPQDAAPGGHYAAIMIGTKPPAGEEFGSRVQTAQFVTSLLFVRMAGEVVEEGTIREFRTTDRLVQKPDTTFEVRFENRGTVHLQPRGEIKIFNMWGAERGVVPINHQTNFGNVLPNSIRQFIFSWRSDVSLYDMGRYKAIATLSYGEEEQYFTSATTYFWVVPIKQLLLVLSILGTSVAVLVFLVRMYVRRMLALAGIDARPIQRGHKMAYEVPVRKRRGVTTVIVSQYSQVTAPVRFEMSTLRDRLSALRGFGAITKSVGLYLWEKRKILLAIGALLVGIVVLVALGKLAVSAVRSYEVTISTGGANITLSAEDLVYNELRAQKPLDSDLATTTAVMLVNISGQVGLGAHARLLLEDAGIYVSEIATDAERQEHRSVVIFNPIAQDQAVVLSKKLGGALLSADESKNQSEITVLVGTDVATLFSQ